MKLELSINSYKKACLLLVFPLISISLFGQQKEAADDLVSEGVSLQDKGQVDSAILIYTHALEIDKNNLLALSEMAYSLLSEDKYDESIEFSKRAIKTHPRDPALKTVYVGYGNALDGLGKTDKSIDIYNDGIKQFPEYFQLHFNKGISQTKLHKTEDALLSFQISATLNPAHASSQNAIGLLLFNENKIASLLAYCRFLILEPNSQRSPENLEKVRTIMGAHVTKKDSENITISLSPDLMSLNKKKQKNNFSSAELMLSLASALDYDSINVNKSDEEKFIRKFSDLCGFLKETEKENYGFYWDYYVPYFTEMNDKEYIKTFTYIVFSSSQHAEVRDWLNSHKKEITEFYKWSDEFKWRIN